MSGGSVSPLFGVSGGHGRVDRVPRTSDAADSALPPAVLVVVDGDAPHGVLREVCAGAEEQGIPTAILVDGPPESGTDAAARHAAGESRLEVGVGIGADGAVVVRHALVPGSVLSLAGGAPAAQVRRAGADAARIVAGLALRTPCADVVLGMAGSAHPGVSPTPVPPAPAARRTRSPRRDAAGPGRSPAG